MTYHRPLEQEGLEGYGRANRPLGPALRLRHLPDGLAGRRSRPGLPGSEVLSGDLASRLLFRERLGLFSQRPGYGWPLQERTEVGVHTRPFREIDTGVG